MRRVLTIAVSALLVGYPFVASADKVIFKIGSEYDVQGFQIGAGAVKMITADGKAWSVLKDVVDVAATRKANGMSLSDTESPGWSSRAGTESRTRDERTPEDASPSEPSRSAGQDRERVPRERTAERERRAPRSGRGVSRDAEGAALSKYVVLVNGGYNGTAINFGSAQSFAQDFETATVQTSYARETGPLLEAGAFYRFHGPWAVGAAVELLNRRTTGQFSANLPHPLFFNRPRTLQGTVPELRYREAALNVILDYSLPIRSRLVVDVFGGPTLFWTRTGLITDVLYTDAYPFDSVTLQAPVTAEQTDTPLGFNVGGGVTYRLSGWLGVGVLFRYNRATVSVSRPSGSAVTFDAGGIRINGGIRLLFH